MQRLKVTETFSADGENYIRILVEDHDSDIYIKTLLRILDDLCISNFLPDEPLVMSTRYRDWLGMHTYIDSCKFSVHVIFEEKYMHLLVRCAEHNRNNLMDALIGYCSISNTGSAV